jgi:hypothetical protein
MTDFLEDTRPQLAWAKKDDWWQFRKAHPYIFIAKTGEDGQQSDWQSLLKDEGSEKLHAVVSDLHAQSDRVYLAAALAAMAPKVEAKKPLVPPPALTGHEDTGIWCICHSPKAYMAWAIEGSGDVSDDRKARITAFATTTREKLCDLHGIPVAKLDLPGWKHELYERTRASKRCHNWLREMRALPKRQKESEA